MTYNLRIGIDLSNIRVGGGITHISEILKVTNPKVDGFSQINVWGGKDILRYLPAEKPWLHVVHEQMLDHSLPARSLWQRLKLPKLSREACDILFIPGGRIHNIQMPFVVMSQNLLPFQPEEIKRYGFSLINLKMKILRLSQRSCFTRACGIIYLTETALNIVDKSIGPLSGKSKIVPHGVSEKFFQIPKEQKPIAAFSNDDPLKLLYVSSIHLYKHQWHVVEAVASLRKQGVPIALDLVGPSAYHPAFRRLLKVIRNVDPTQSFIRYRGNIPYKEVHSYYHQADVFVFASSCENMPNILLEAMASGLPIACSNRGPMPEVMGNAGIYFDPERPAEIAEALRRLIEDPNLRAEKAALAFQRAKKFTWDRCARDTFEFIAQVATRQGEKSNIMME